MTKLLASIALVAGSMLAGIGPSLAQTPQTEGQLVVYASHPAQMVDHFLKMFGDKYGVKVSSVKAGTGELLNRIKAERSRPAADVMWGGFSDTGASSPDLFDVYRSPHLLPFE